MMQAEQEEESILDRKSLPRRKNNHNSLFCKVLEKIQVDTGLRLMYTRSFFFAPITIPTEKHEVHSLRGETASWFLLTEGPAVWDAASALVLLFNYKCWLSHRGPSCLPAGTFLSWGLQRAPEDKGPQHQGGACIPDKPRLSNNFP